MQSQKAFVSAVPQTADQQAWVTPAAVAGLGFDLFQYRILDGLHTGEDLGVEFSDDDGVFLLDDLIALFVLIIFHIKQFIAFRVEEIAHQFPVRGADHAHVGFGLVMGAVFAIADVRPFDVLAHERGRDVAATDALAFGQRHAGEVK